LELGVALLWKGSKYKRFPSTLKGRLRIQIQSKTNDSEERNDDRDYMMKVR
jgi:hypothetical protein